jgi:hypothetical protein
MNPNKGLMLQIFRFQFISRNVRSSKRILDGMSMSFSFFITLLEADPVRVYLIFKSQKTLRIGPRFLKGRQQLLNLLELPRKLRLILELANSFQPLLHLIIFFTHSITHTNVVSKDLILTK